MEPPVGRPGPPGGGGKQGVLTHSAVSDPCTLAAVADTARNHAHTAAGCTMSLIVHLCPTVGHSLCDARLPCAQCAGTGGGAPV